MRCSEYSPSVRPSGCGMAMFLSGTVTFELCGAGSSSGCFGGTRLSARPVPRSSLEAPMRGWSPLWLGPPLRQTENFAL
eukprot:6505542-Prymnesium_polylepis.1